MFTQQQKLVAAIDLAVSAHGMQLDKVGWPYILHPLHVMDQINSYSGKIVAVLHDVVEDTDTTLQDIIDHAVGFDDHIIAAIDAITKRKGEKHKDYLLRVKNNPLALMVKLKDIEHNSSEERLDYLPFSEADFLRKKYKHALEFLHAPSSD